jgi:hypothetical protein
VVWIGRPDYEAFFPFAQSRHVEHAARPSHEGFGNRQLVPAWFSVHLSAEALQHIPSPQVLERCRLRSVRVLRIRSWVELTAIERI